MRSGRAVQPQLRRAAAAATGRPAVARPWARLLSAAAAAGAAPAAVAAAPASPPPQALPLERRVQDFTAALTASRRAAKPVALDAQWAALAALSSEYLAAATAAAATEAAAAPPGDPLPQARVQLYVAYLALWDAAWAEAVSVHGEPTLCSSEYYANPASGRAPTSSLAHFRGRVLQAVVAAWYGCALALGVPLPLATHTAVVRLAGLRSLTAAKLALHAVPLFGVAPDGATLHAVLEACVRHGQPGQAWPYLVALAVRGLPPRAEVLDALVEQAEGAVAAGDAWRTGQHQRLQQQQQQQLVSAAAPGGDADAAADAGGDDADAAADGGEVEENAEVESAAGGETTRGRAGRRRRRAEAPAAPPPPLRPVSGAPGPLPRDPGVSALLDHSLGLQAERVRDSIAELRQLRAEASGIMDELSHTSAHAAAVVAEGRALSDDTGDAALAARLDAFEADTESSAADIAGKAARAALQGDELLAMAAAQVNQAYGMPLEPEGGGGGGGAPGSAPAAAAGDGGGPFSVPPLSSREGTIVMALTGGSDDGGENAEDDEHGDDDDDDVEYEEVDEDEAAADEAAYARLGAEARVVRAALFGGSAPAVPPAAVTEGVRADALLAPAAGGGGGGSDGGALPTALVPAWVLTSLAAETARRELAGAHLLPTMVATATGADDGDAAVAAVAAGHRSPQLPSLPPPPPQLLRERLEFVARHSVLALPPDSPVVAGEVTRWQVALLAVARRAAADVEAAAAARTGGGAGSGDAASAVPESQQPQPQKRYVSLPYLSLLTTPGADPRRPESLLPGAATSAAAPAAADAERAALFARLHPLYTPPPAAAAAASPSSPGARLALAHALHRVYRSLLLDEEGEGDGGGSGGQPLPAVASCT